MKPTKEQELKIVLTGSGIDISLCKGFIGEIAQRERSYFELTKALLPHEEREELRYKVIQLELLAFIIGRATVL